jgi:hypothetical protein
MKARNLIITAGAILALAASPALAAIPGDGGTRIGLGTQPLHVVKAPATAIKVGAYNAHTYLQYGASDRVGKAITKVGAYNAHTYLQYGASDRVGKAITKVGKKKVAPASTKPLLIWIKSVGTPTPAPDLDPEQECYINGNCTIEQNCVIWGLYCDLVQTQPATTVAPAGAANAAEPALASAVVSVADVLGEGSASSSAGSTEASDEGC